MGVRSTYIYTREATAGQVLITSRTLIQIEEFALIRLDYG